MSRKANKTSKKKSKVSTSGKHKHKKSRKKFWMCASIILIPLLLWVFITLTESYGFLQKSAIDDRDLAKWHYDDGFIKGAKGFAIVDLNDTCWLMIHGYASTPLEMKELAEKIHTEFGDSVFVHRLSGHAQVPSLMLDKNAEIWYEEVSDEYERIDNMCDKVNVVGSSFGGMLALRLAEEEDVNHVYTLSPYLYINSGVISKETQLKLFGNLLHYEKKKIVGSINDPEGLKMHRAYMNLPFRPLVNSFDFIDETIDDLGKITEPLLTFHSKNDKTVDPKSSEKIMKDISSVDKQVIWFEKSNHVLLMDYDRETVISDMIKFEKDHR